MAEKTIFSKEVVNKETTSPSKKIKLVIVAGGKGTRLGLTDIPKPMVKIGGKPVLHHQIELAKKSGIEDIYILSGYLSSQR